jgi:hypothetical protein
MPGGTPDGIPVGTPDGIPLGLPEGSVTPAAFRQALTFSSCAARSPVGAAVGRLEAVAEAAGVAVEPEEVVPQPASTAAVAMAAIGMSSRDFEYTAGTLLMIVRLMPMVGPVRFIGW